MAEGNTLKKTLAEEKSTETLTFVTETRIPWFPVFSFFLV